MSVKLRNVLFFLKLISSLLLTRPFGKSAYIILRSSLSFDTCKTGGPNCNVSWIGKYAAELSTTATRLIKQRGSKHMAFSKALWVTMADVMAYITSPL